MAIKLKEVSVSLLRKISLGKYQTTLINKHGLASYSSALGGIVTIVAMSVIGIAILLQLVAVFTTSHYSLDIEGQLIQAYVDNSEGYIQGNVTTCSSCKAITVR